jgi:hypothetical protein
MKEKDFDELKQSVVEVGLMMRGELEPSREFKLKKDKQTWAICVSHEDDELVPLKLYRIEVYPSLSKVAVKDESGETLICPQSFFLPVKFEEEVTDYLKKVA